MKLHFHCKETFLLFLVFSLLEVLRLWDKWNQCFYFCFWTFWALLLVGEENLILSLILSFLINFVSENRVNEFSVVVRTTTAPTMSFHSDQLTNKNILIWETSQENGNFETICSPLELLQQLSLPLGLWGIAFAVGSYTYIVGIGLVH